MAVRAYIHASARLVTTQSSFINTASQPAADIVAFKRAAAPSLLQSASQFCGVPVTFLNRNLVQRKDGGSIRCMATQKSLEVGADIIDKVKQDHKELEEAYSNYKKYHKQGNEEEAGKWFNQFVWEISRHAVTEELVLYPLIASQGEKGQKLADQSRDEHQQTKNMLVEIQNIQDGDAFEKKFDEIMHVLREHISKEEKEDLVYLEQNVDQGGREAAGTTFALGKNLVPTKPHAAVPNRSAIVEGALGLFATPIDKLRDVFTPYPSAKDN
jgi:hemerythrin superfamily protein